MSIPRKDVRVYLDWDMHAALRVITDHKGVEMAAWCESLIAAEIQRIAHDSIVVAEGLKAIPGSRGFADNAGVTR